MRASGRNAASANQNCWSCTIWAQRRAGQLTGQGAAGDVPRRAGLAIAEAPAAERLELKRPAAHAAIEGAGGADVARAFDGRGVEGGHDPALEQHDDRTAAHSELRDGVAVQAGERHDDAAILLEATTRSMGGRRASALPSKRNGSAFAGVVALVGV